MKYRTIQRKLLLWLLLFCMSITCVSASAVVQASTAAEKQLTALNGLTAAASGRHKVTLNWNAVEGADGYLVYSQKSGQYGYTGMTAKTSFTDTAASATEWNFYWVYPYYMDGSGKRVVGKCEKYVYAKGLLPAATGLKVTSQQGQVMLQWNPVAGSDGYIIYRRIGNGSFEYRYIVKGTVFYDTTASKDEWNFYRVYPYYMESGKRLLSSSISYVYGKRLPIALEVPNLRIASKYGRVEIRWDQVNNADGYCLMRRVGNSSFVTIDANVSKYQTYYNDQNASTTEWNFYKVVPYVNGELCTNTNYVYAKRKIENLSVNGSHLVDITTFAVPDANTVRTMIESYAVPQGAYLDGNVRVPGDFDAAIQRRNIAGVSNLAAKYGILTANAAMRSFPTYQKIANELSATAFDLLQETMLSAGEGVIVLHQSADQAWSFVQAEYYCGWIETAKIGFCTREEMCAFVKSTNFVVITQPVINIGGVNFRMGSRLPMSAAADQVCTVRIPKSDAQGRLYISEMQVGMGAVSIGYLEQSSEAIVRQARKLVGSKYGWGDTNECMDCTSTLRAVYNCFGIVLPRNSSWMPNTILNVTNLQQMNIEQKRAAISRLKPGSILLISGHAMMYIGVENGVHSMLHNVTQYVPSWGGAVVKPESCVITPIDIRSAAGVSYLELYKYAISP